MFGALQTRRFLPLVAESFAIIVSILLAFSIDAWWANRQERAEEQNMLLVLQSEFQTNLALIENERNYRNAVLSSIQRLWDASQGSATLEVEELDKLIGDITWWALPDYSLGAIESVVRGGRLPIIQNEELRVLLASFPTLFANTIEDEKLDQDTTRNVVYPFLRQNASFAQIANTMQAGRPGTGESPAPPVYPVGPARDHSASLSNPEFIGLLIEEYWDHLDANNQYDSLQAGLERALGLIDESLEN